MQTEQIDIRKILREELSLVRDFPPPDWSLDLEKVYAHFYDRDYCYPAAATIQSEIVGTGIAIVNDTAAWLGTIIVEEGHRNKGIGNAITRHLIEYSQSRGRNTILLSASDLGLPLYRKIGFEHDLNYVFFKTDTPGTIETANTNIRGISANDYDRIVELDTAISGEKRRQILSEYVATGFVYARGAIRGFYLPGFGKGLIIAESDEAGLALLQFRLSRDASPVCVPETNKAAIGYLHSRGYYQYLTTPRMYLNVNVEWNSRHVFSRSSGYLG